MLFNLLAILFSTAVLIHARAGASGTPSAYVCPAEDTAGFPLGSSNESSDPIFCSYPAFPGENPNDFYCNYSKTTGQLTLDNDAGFCPANAQLASIVRRRHAHPPLPTRPRNAIHGFRDHSTRRISYLKKRRVGPRHPL